MPDTNSAGYTHRGGPRDRSLRVSDRERDVVADVLREQHLQGRLASDEFQERLERCLAAKTYAELDALVVDFPHDDETDRRARGWAWPLAFASLVLIAIAASGGHLFWLIFPLVFFFVVRPLLWRSRGLGTRGSWACGPRYGARSRA